jgi:alpha-dioxygenase
MYDVRCLCIVSHQFLQLLEPHPTVVASKLLARKKFIDNGEQFNMIACSWIQFMIHDWVDNLEDTEQVLT